MGPKNKRLSEALVNSFGAFPIGYGASLVILPAFAPWIQKDPITTNILITTIYATISFARVYFLRQFFDKMGCDDNLVRVVARLLGRARTKFTKARPLGPEEMEK